MYRSEVSSVSRSAISSNSIVQGLTGCVAEDFHITGHSLGAHTAGYAGEWLITNISAKLGRITGTLLDCVWRHANGPQSTTIYFHSGMDAAGPYFENTPATVRLDPSDAAFVDGIHTNGDKLRSLGWGISEPVGDVDFYPNGGVYQPGCPKSEADPGNLIINFNFSFKIWPVPVEVGLYAMCIREIFDLDSVYHGHGWINTSDGGFGWAGPI